MEMYKYAPKIGGKMLHLSTSLHEISHVVFE